MILSYCSFGSVLRQLRKQRNLTQDAFGAQIGLSKAVVSKYENEIGFPSLDVLIRIADFYGVTTDYLLGVEREKHVDVSGLSDAQIEAVQHVILEFKKQNKK